MTRLTSVLRAALVLLALSGFAGPALAQTPPPAKVERLIEVLSDPEVRAWLDQQLKSNAPVPIAPSATTKEAAMMSTGLTMIRAHGADLIRAFPGLPAQFDRARGILMREFQDRGLVVILALIAGFVAAGIGLEKVLRSRMGGYRDWMKSIPTTNPVGRLRGLGARILYALMMIAAFMLGSAGVFLLFDWPPLLREIVLAFLTVAIVTRVALILCRVALVPPFLGLPVSADYRIVAMTDARATHWYNWVGLCVGWFVLVGVTLNLMQTFGFDAPGRVAVGVVAGFVQLVLVLLAVWLRPADPLRVTFGFYSPSISFCYPGGEGPLGSEAGS